MPRYSIQRKVGLGIGGSGEHPKEPACVGLELLARLAVGPVVGLALGLAVDLAVLLAVVPAVGLAVVLAVVPAVDLADHPAGRFELLQWSSPLQQLLS